MGVDERKSNDSSGRTPPDLVIAQLASQRTLATARLSTVGFFIMTWATRDPNRPVVTGFARLRILST
jgi:hypothetical protein